MIAQKWNDKENKYLPYELPEKASCFEYNMNEVICCADCGNEMTYGEGYTSLYIHTPMGFGYSVCKKCYAEEFQLRVKKYKKGGK